MAMINMQSWMFLSSFEKLRGKLLLRATIAIHGTSWVSGLSIRLVELSYQRLLSCLQNANAPNSAATSYDLSMAVREQKSQTLNAIACRSDRSCVAISRSCTTDFEQIPGSPIAYWLSENFLHAFEAASRLEDIAHARQGHDNWQTTTNFFGSGLRSIVESSVSATSREDAQASK